MRLVLLGIIAVVTNVSEGKILTPMRWVDNTTIDTFFDRIVFIGYYEERFRENIIYEIVDDKPVKKIVNEPYDYWSDLVTGALIKRNLVLTSFNALRNSTRDLVLVNMIVEILTGRAIDQAREVRHYLTNSSTVECGRQVIPSLTEDWPIHMRHGHHTPVHDLMVLRLSKMVDFKDPVPPVLTDFQASTNWSPIDNFYVNNEFGPIRSILAKPDDMLVQDKLKFASIGHLTEKHINSSYKLETGNLGAIVDCEEWFPREWGYFICLQNLDNFPGLSSSAMLYSDTTLFGVGAFMLRKEVNSILVFTDVRIYWHLLYRTCTKDDQALRDPKDL